jgi:hypothetical protein
MSRLLYGNETVTASDSFMVSEGVSTGLEKIWIYLWLALISAILVLLVIYLLRRRSGDSWWMKFIEHHFQGKKEGKPERLAEERKLVKRFRASS